MADYDGRLPVRAVATDVTVEVANSSGTTIDPATETTLSTINGKLNSLGQKTSANSVPVVVASDQSAIPVTFSTVDKVNVFDYNTASAVAAGSSSTHTYTPGTSFYLNEIVCSGRGQAKFEIQYGNTGSETTKFVLFTSTSEKTVILRLTDPLFVTTAQTIKIIRTNLDNQASDLYSTVSGNL